MKEYFVNMSKNTKMDNLKLSVEGYKSLSDKVTLDINGLTVIAGKNSSGKSSFMQPILLIKQSLEKQGGDGYLSLYGENVKATDSSQLLSKVSGKTHKSFTVSLSSNTDEVSISYKPDEEGLSVYSVFKKDEDDFKDGVELTVDDSSEELSHKLSHLENEKPLSLFKQQSEYVWSVEKNKCFLEPVFKPVDDESSPVKVGLDVTKFLGKIAFNTIHVSGLRGNPERTYQVHHNQKNHFSGSFEKYVANLVYQWKRGNDEKYSQLVDYLKRLELTSNISAERLDDTRVELKVARYENADKDDVVNIVDVGFGVSQALPVLVALLVAKEDQLVYIEQPELHLHPKAEYELSKVICEAVARGVRVVVETHSDIVLRAFQTLVVRSVLNKDDVLFSWFTQCSKTGRTSVENLKLNENGAYGESSIDLDNISLSVESEYLDSIFELKNKGL